MTAFGDALERQEENQEESKKAERIKLLFLNHLSPDNIGSRNPTFQKLVESALKIYEGKHGDLINKVAIHLLTIGQIRIDADTGLVYLHKPYDKPVSDVAKVIVIDIIKDLNDRAGIGIEADPGIMEEIHNTLACIVDKHLEEIKIECPSCSWEGIMESWT